MSARIVITQMGAVTPFGIGLETFWSDILAEKSGVSKIQKFDTSELPVKIAADKLKAGAANRMVVVGAESTLAPVIIYELNSSRALSTYNERPDEASRPFDFYRDGFVIGEGAGVLVLETLKHAKKHKTDIKAELLGYANTGSAYHVTAPEPDGDGEIKCMNKALEMAGLGPGDINYINAHGTSTPAGDRIETLALKSVLGNDSYTIPIISTKGATGHLIGATGIIELIACVKAIQDDVVPPTINLNYSDPECDLDYVPNKKRKVDVGVAMSNSFSFGGQNASIILGEF